MFVVSLKRKPLIKTWLILLAGICFIALILFCGSLQKDTMPSKKAEPAPTDRERVAYLTDLGWQVDPVPIESLILTLPAPLDEEFEAYNALQVMQGFDLSPYAGKQIVRYSYLVKNHPSGTENIQINLYLHDNMIIAGDVLGFGDTPFIDTLLFPA